MSEIIVHLTGLTRPWCEGCGQREAKYGVAFGPVSASLCALCALPYAGETENGGEG